MDIKDFTFDEMSKRDNRIFNILRIETLFKLITSTSVMTYLLYTKKAEQFEMGNLIPYKLALNVHK